MVSKIQKGNERKCEKMRGELYPGEWMALYICNVHGITENVGKC